jgi:hypothetical protein
MPACHVVGEALEGHAVRLVDGSLSVGVRRRGKKRSPNQGSVLPYFHSRRTPSRGAVDLDKGADAYSCACKEPRRRRRRKGKGMFPRL